MRRQQLTLLALRRRVDPLGLLERAPELLSIAKDHLWTTIKRKDLPSLAELAATVQACDVERVYFTPPQYPEVLTTDGIKAIRQTVRHVFDGGQREAGAVAMGAAAVAAVRRRARATRSPARTNHSRGPRNTPNC